MPLLRSVPRIIANRFMIDRVKREDGSELNEALKRTFSCPRIPSEIDALEEFPIRDDADSKALSFQALHEVIRAMSVVEDVDDPVGLDQVTH